jgi:hypothetical protein
MAVADSFVGGHALRRAETTAELAPDVTVGDQSRNLLEIIASGPYPRMRRIWATLEGWRPGAAAWMDESFECWLSALFEGLVRLHSEQP